MISELLDLHVTTDTLWTQQADNLHELLTFVVHNGHTVGEERRWPMLCLPGQDALPIPGVAEDVDYVV